MRIVAIAILMLIEITSFGQIQMTGKLEDHIGGILDAIPGSSGNSYADPDGTEVPIWNATVDDMINLNITEAVMKASTVGYDVVHFTDNSGAGEKQYYILQKTVASDHHWGTYVFNADACREQLIIQAPHPKYDLNTGDQGVFVFKQVDALAFFVSGTHRCNSTTATSCSGSTSACAGGSQPYRISDVAHNVNSAFHLATQRMAAAKSEAIFIQLHGFGKDTSDPYLIMSNGTRITPTKDYISLIWDELENLDGTLTAKIAHLDFTWDKLVALTNTQGRMINNSFNPCTDNATNTQGRFIHIEQELTKLRADQSKWSIMASALSEVFPCGTVTSAKDKERGVRVTVYPNPFVDHITFSGIKKQTQFILYDVLGKEVVKDIITDEEEIALSELKSGGYYYHLIDNRRIIHTGKLYKTIIN